MQKLAIDFGSVKAGGGVEQCLTLIDSLVQAGGLLGQIVFIAPDAPVLRRAVAETGRPFAVLPGGVASRLLFERNQLPAFFREHEVTHSFAAFGVGYPLGESVRQVCNIAYPIICYKESPFWRHIGPLQAVKQRIKNRARVGRLRRHAARVLVETEVMKNRLIDQCGIDPRRLAVVPPVEGLGARSARESIQHSGTRGKGVSALILSGLAQHKNLWRLPAICRELRTLGIAGGEAGFRFRCSFSREAFLTLLRDNSVQFHAEDEAFFEFLGPVPSGKLGALLDEADCLLNISDLESVTNNYIEAAASGLRIVCSDRDFARTHDAVLRATYVEPHDVVSVATAIADLIARGDFGRVERRRIGIDPVERLNLVLEEIARA